MATYDTFIVNGDLRTIQIPASCNGILGVESDEKVAQIPFRIPRYYGDLDLTTFEPRVNYLNANGEIGVTICTFSESDDEYAFFTWEVDRRATRYVGTTSFVVCLILTDADGTILREFNTTVQKLEVLAGIEAENQLENEYTDIISYILNRLDQADLATTYTIEIQDGELVLVGADGSRSSATLPESNITLFRVSVDDDDPTVITANASTGRDQHIVPGETVNLQFLETSGAGDYLTFNVSYRDETLVTEATYQLYNQREEPLPSIPEGTILAAVCVGDNKLQLMSVPEGSDVASLSTRVDQNAVDIGALNTTMSQVQTKQNEHEATINELYQDKTASIYSADGSLIHEIRNDSGSSVVREVFGTLGLSGLKEVTLSNGLTVYGGNEYRIKYEGARFSGEPRNIQLTIRTFEEVAGDYPVLANITDVTDTYMKVRVVAFAPIAKSLRLYYHIVGVGRR